METVKTSTASAPLEIFIDGYFFADNYSFASYRCRIGCSHAERHQVGDRPTPIFHDFADLDDLYAAMQGRNDEFQVIACRLNIAQGVAVVMALLQQLNDSDSVADLYDKNPMLAEAIDVLKPGFEYPDVSFLTIAELKKLARRTLL